MNVIEPGNANDVIQLIQKYEQDLKDGKILIDIRNASYLHLLSEEILGFLATYCGIIPQQQIDTFESLLTKCNLLPSNIIRLIADKTKKSGYTNYHKVSLHKLFFLLAKHKNTPIDILDDLSKFENVYYLCKNDSIGNSTFYQIAYRNDATDQILNNIIDNISKTENEEPYGYVDQILELVGQNPNISQPTIEKLSKIDFSYVASTPKLPNSFIDIMLLSGDNIKSDLAKNTNLPKDTYIRLV